MRILEKIKKLWTTKFFTQEEEETANELKEQFLIKTGLNDLYKIDNMLDYLFIYFRACHISTTLHAEVESFLARSLVENIFYFEKGQLIDLDEALDEDVLLEAKRIIKFHLTLHSHDLVDSLQDSCGLDFNEIKKTLVKSITSHRVGAYK